VSISPFPLPILLLYLQENWKSISCLTYRRLLIRSFIYIKLHLIVCPLSFILWSELPLFIMIANQIILTETKVRNTKINYFSNSKENGVYVMITGKQQKPTRLHLFLNNIFDNLFIVRYYQKPHCPILDDRHVEKKRPLYIQCLLLEWNHSTDTYSL
jgi:hypothetical protein